MRRKAWLVIVIPALLAGCGSANGTQSQSPTASACITGYSPQSPSIRLTNGDDGRTIDVHLCDSIWVYLTGTTAQPWQFVQSSDTSVVAVVPLPLPHPPGGGTEAVYIAKHVGSAELAASGVVPPCVPNAHCPPPPHWMVSVRVMP